jgi:hypothetical protein
MSLWGNLDNATGNQKPIFSNTSTTYGVSVTEAANTDVDGPKVTHSGWVKQSLGTGSLVSIAISNTGTGINASGFLTISGGGGSGANASYAIANSQNTMQSFSTNPAWNVIASITINDPGSGYTSAPTITYTGANTIRPQFAATVGGRSGRRFYETLVATGSIAGDDSNDDTYFPGT